MTFNHFFYVNEEIIPGPCSEKMLSNNPHREQLAGYINLKKRKNDRLNMNIQANTHAHTHKQKTKTETFLMIA